MSKKLHGPPTGKWKKAEKAEKLREAERERVREIYHNKRKVEIIPASIDIKKDNSNIKRVAAYCRVSTLEDAQAGSFERQIQHFKEKIDNNENWINVGIYADEGVTGTNTKHRRRFQCMIQDCRDGKIDLILTKSVSRFARNTSDCLNTVRELKKLTPPVGVIFEDISLDTLEEKNEFVLGIISLIAQGESEMKSAAITWSVIERFKKGIPIISTHNLLGYDKDHLNRLVIVEEEAEVIRYIYECYLDGQTIREIAKSLTDSHVPTPTGKNVWSGGTIRSILRNEKYCGDVIMQKTFTVDCFSHKTVINRGQREQYYIKDHHNAIIPRKDWERVQIMLKKPRRQSNGKHNKPEEKFRITRIKSGHLKGFAVIDCQWKETDIDKFFNLLNSYDYKRR